MRNAAGRTGSSSARRPSCPRRQGPAPQDSHAPHHGKCDRTIYRDQRQRYDTTAVAPAVPSNSCSPHETTLPTPCAVSHLIRRSMTRAQISDGRGPGDQGCSQLKCSEQPIPLGDREVGIHQEDHRTCKPETRASRDFDPIPRLHFTTSDPSGRTIGRRC